VKSLLFKVFAAKSSETTKLGDLPMSALRREQRRFKRKDKRKERKLSSYSLTCLNIINYVLHWLLTIQVYPE